MRFHDASPVWRQQATPKQRDSNAISSHLVPLGFPNVDGGAAPGLVGGVTVRGDQPASRDRASPRQRGSAVQPRGRCTEKLTLLGLADQPQPAQVAKHSPRALERLPA